MPIKESSFVLDWALRIMLAMCTSGIFYIYNSIVSLEDQFDKIQEDIAKIDKLTATYTATTAVQLSASQGAILDLQKRVLDISAQQIRNVSRLDELQRDNDRNYGQGPKSGR